MAVLNGVVAPLAERRLDQGPIRYCQEGGYCLAPEFLVTAFDQPIRAGPQDSELALELGRADERVCVVERPDHPFEYVEQLPGCRRGRDLRPVGFDNPGPVG